MTDETPMAELAPEIDADLRDALNFYGGPDASPLTALEDVALVLLYRLHFVRDNAPEDVYTQLVGVTAQMLMHARALGTMPKRIDT